MCGIVGYIGDREASEILLEGLERLEYRGYDSAGIAVTGDKALKLCKREGRLENLRQAATKTDLSGTVGVGHTRWATHGRPSDENSHPHLSNDGRIAVVHNGIIENYASLRKLLEEKGFHFLSETDTEVIPNLISLFYRGDLLRAVREASAMLKGSYALGIISAYEPQKLIAVKKHSPLIIGLKEGENFIASDIPAILKHTRSVCIPEDGDAAVIDKDSVRIYSADGSLKKRPVYDVAFDGDAAERAGYEHFMLKEIHEQPRAVRDTLSEMRADAFAGLTVKDALGIRKIFAVACGTAYHACLTCKTAVERLAGIPVEAEIASEFRYCGPIIKDGCLTVVISQSGETADTLAAMRLAKAEGSRVLAITNVVGSTLSREADGVFYTHAGPEIAVASTKAYVTQLAAVYAFAIFLAKSRDFLSKRHATAYEKELCRLPELAERTLAKSDGLFAVSERLAKARDVFYLGRGLDRHLAMEGSLKLKEISYIHSEAYAAGELKHGPIALVEKGTPVVCISTSERLHQKLLSNALEVSARGAYTIGIIREDLSPEGFDSVFTLPKTDELFMPVLAAIPLQLIAYKVSVLKGFDVDKPRNLAKSVTVE